ncbi:MAG: hypothetical protein ABJK59_02030 [Erythrobacter sp.]|uniref:hypothetical protein n=1 Tax=Erythrobacter sp. TaxID=1042 RepID=UPI003299B61E
MTKFLIHYAEGTDFERAQAASSLAEFLSASSSELDVELLRQSDTSMDLGTLVQVILAAPASIILAKGIADFLRRYGSGKFSIVTDDGEMVVEGLDRKATAEIIKQALEKHGG